MTPTFLSIDGQFPAIESNTYILVPRTVTDLSDFVENHERDLVSIYDEPQRAAMLWQERAKRGPYGDEGFVSLSHFGQDLVSGEMWDQVGGIWQSLVEAVEMFLDAGAAETWFPGQPAPIRLRRQRKSVVLTIGTTVAVIDPETFFPGVLDEAERYCAWVEEHIGTREVSTLERIERARELLRA